MVQTDAWLLTQGCTMVAYNMGGAMKEKAASLIVGTGMHSL
jgi:hypothetical protein